MPEWVDLLDSKNQKYDNTTSGLTADNTKDAIDELVARPAPAPDLTDAEFPSYAVFDAKVVGAAAIDFASGNKQEVDAATHANVTVASPTGHPGNFMLTILNSGSLASIAPAAGGAIEWEDGTPPQWSNKTVLALYYDGTVWVGSGIVNVS